MIKFDIHKFEQDTSHLNPDPYINRDKSGLEGVLEDVMFDARMKKGDGKNETVFTNRDYSGSF
jgi:hypothetical protein